MKKTKKKMIRAKDNLDDFKKAVADL